MEKKSLFTCAVIFLFILIGCNNNKQSINVGAIFPMSGDWGNYGVQMANGLKMWELDNPESNIKIIYEDGQGNVNTSITAFNKLIHTNNIQVCISGVSPVMLGLASLSDRNRVLTINAGATNPEIKNASKNIFCIIPDAHVEATYIADFLVDSLKRFSSFVYWKNDDSGKGMLDSFQKRYQEKGGEVAGNEPIGSLESIKMTLLKIKNLNIKTVFIPTNGEMIAKVIRQAYNMNMHDILWVGYAAAESPELIQELSNISNVKFIFSSYSYKSSQETSRTKEFIKKYKQNFKHIPQYYSATCYDAISLVAQAIENNCKTSEDIKRYICSLEKYDGVSGSLIINGNNYVSSGMTFSMFYKGNIIPVNINLF